MARGTLITIEGIDGAGKTTLAEALRAALAERGVTLRLLREPGGVALAEEIRALVKRPGLAVGPAAETLLYAAARAQLVEELLEPALARGEPVLLDRFVDSSLAYQGAGRGLGLDTVRTLNELATRGIAPDRTLLLALPPELASGRQDGRGDAADRLEREQRDFFARVSAAYEELARSEPERFRVIDATGTPEAVLAAAVVAVEDLF